MRSRQAARGSRVATQTDGRATHAHTHAHDAHNAHAGKFTAADVIGLAVMAHSLLGQRFARDDDKAFQKALVANLIDFPQVRRVCIPFAYVPLQLSIHS